MASRQDSGLFIFFFISDTRKLRAHGATVEIYRTQGQLQKSNSSKFSNLKLRFGQFSDLCSVVNSRHVLTLSRRGWLHFTRGQREISQRAQVRGKQREEREGAPPKSFSFLPLQHWQIRLQRWEAEARWSMLLEASRDQERLGKGLWAQAPGVPSKGSFPTLALNWKREPLPNLELSDSRQGICPGAPPAGQGLQHSSDLLCGCYSPGLPAKPPPVTVPRGPREERSSKANRIQTLK